MWREEEGGGTEGNRTDKILLSNKEGQEGNVY